MLAMASLVGATHHLLLTAGPWLRADMSECALLQHDVCVMNTATFHVIGTSIQGLCFHMLQICRRLDCSALEVCMTMSDARGQHLIATAVPASMAVWYTCG